MPVVELVPDVVEDADTAEADRFVERHARIVRQGYPGYRQAEAQGAEALQQLLVESRSDSTPNGGAVDIGADLDCAVVSGSCPMPASVGVADHAAAVLGDQPQAARA